MLQFEFNGHTSDEYGLIVTRIEENDTLVNRSLQLGEKNKYRPKENQLNLKDQAETALKERQAEYDAAKKPEIQEKRNQIAKDVLMENFGKVQEKYPAFTDKETYIIKSLYNQATYSNENIIITTLDSTVDAVDKAITLYKDAVEELYVESHPQYTYTDEIGNIYALPEFREYHDQLAVNDFVRLGLSDTRYVKLRVVEIRFLIGFLHIHLMLLQ